MDKDMGVAADAAAPSPSGSSPVPGLDASHSVTNAQRERSAHTPGPWTAEGPDMFGDFNILHPADSLAVGAVVSNLRPEAEVAANARLIAAASDLLAALKGLVTSLAENDEDGLTEFAEPMVAARAAIAKAEGAL